MVTLGLDIGTNSVGSAWVDTEQKLIECGVGIFPAGIEDSDDKGRGEPKGRERRQARQIRRVLHRRAERKRALTKVLIEHGLLPAAAVERQKLWEMNPWHLRRRAVSKEPNDRLTAHEMGRVLIHLSQRRGAFGVHVRDEQEDETGESVDGEKKPERKKGKEGKEAASPEGKIKKAIGAAKVWLDGRTFGQAMADDYDARQHKIEGKEGKFYNDPIRNRRDSYERCADRDMIRDEFLRIWDCQKCLQPAGSALAKKLGDDLFKAMLDEPNPSEEKKARVFRHAGLIFQQRRHYWDVGTLGRCDLEPTDRCCPVGDRHGQYFRVIETVNNLRLSVRGQQKDRALTASERADVIKRLREQKTGSVATIREALRIDKRSLKKKGEPEDFYRLNIEADAKREINTDRFWSEVVLEAIGEPEWEKWDEKRREWLNRELLRLDPESPGDDQKLRDTAVKRWGLSEPKAALLVAAWQKRSRGEARLKLSRKAIVNLMPYMDREIVNKFGEPSWPTITDARQAFALDRSNGATLEQRARYAHWVSDELRGVLLEGCDGDVEAVERLLSLRGMNARDRHYVAKHKGQLPPPPMLANPVVRKAIHEVRRHVDAYLTKFGKKPDRIVIELARDATQPKKRRDQELKMNRAREDVRRKIIKLYRLDEQSQTQKDKAFQRVLLCRQQREHCAYSETAITERDAAAGMGIDGPIEIDHIIPQACGGGDDWANKVVCYVKANRDKGCHSPHQWLDAARFERMEQVFGHLQGVRRDVDETGYFTGRDCLRKWENLHRDPRPDAADWRPSQLTDTSYAATEVARYLQSGLYPDDPVGFKKPGDLTEQDSYSRKIIFTKGRYTAKLREDWQLYQRLRDQSTAAAGGSIKDRFDHRHHAIDAVAIACVNEKVLQQIGRSVREYDEKRLAAIERGVDPDAVSKPAPVAPPAPWGSVGEFRQAVLSRLFEEFDAADAGGRRSGDSAAGHDGLVWAVSHRPRNRRIVGFLHKSTQYGAVITPSGERVADRATIRQWVFKSPQDCLKPAHLRVGRYETTDETVARIAAELRGSGASAKAAKLKATELVATGSPQPRWVDPKPEKTGIVRDRELRRVLREQISQRGLDPDSFSAPDLRASLEKKGSLHQKSGVPIHSVVLLWSNNDPVVINRWSTDATSGARTAVYDAVSDGGDKRAARIYDSQSNHHIEIRQTDGAGWTGEVVRTYDVARRKSSLLRALAEAEAIECGKAAATCPFYGVMTKRAKRLTCRFGHRQKQCPVREAMRAARQVVAAAHPIIDRRENRAGAFVMSLAVGEMLSMRHPETRRRGIFVVFKIDGSGAVHLTPHWDARRAKGEKDANGDEIEGTEREDVGKGIVAAKLQNLGVEPGKPPVKVRVSPLGEVIVLERD